MGAAYLKGNENSNVALTIGSGSTHCIGKVAFDSAALAHAVVNRYQYSVAEKRTLYRCRKCGKWHVGREGWMSGVSKDYHKMVRKER